MLGVTFQATNQQHSGIRKWDWTHHHQFSIHELPCYCGLLAIPFLLLKQWAIIFQADKGLKEEPDHQYFPHDIWAALRLSNILFQMKDSLPSSLNNNFIIDNYKARNCIKHFINPLLTVTNSLLWHISASDKLLTPSTISINRSRRCSLIISLLHGLWAFV